MQNVSHAAKARTFFRLSRPPSSRRPASAFTHGPAPPRLPKEEQELYERLQRSSTGAFSAPRPTVVVNESASSSSSTSSSPPPGAPARPIGSQINQLPHASSPSTSASPTVTEDGSVSDHELDMREQGKESGAEARLEARVKATGEGEELHPDVRRGTRPEFEGERNPVTGEVGGPKNEPLRWGGGVDWSYNGRVTDF